MLSFLGPWRSPEDCSLILHVDPPHLEPNLPIRKLYLQYLDGLQLVGVKELMHL